MAIKYFCEHCNQRLKSREIYAGKTMNCPSCKKVTRVPPIDKVEVVPDAHVEDLPSPAPTPETETSLSKTSAFRQKKKILAILIPCVVLFLAMIIGIIINTRADNDRREAIAEIDKMISAANSIFNDGNTDDIAVIRRAEEAYKKALEKNDEYLNTFENPQFHTNHKKLLDILGNREFVNASVPGMVKQEGKWYTAEEWKTYQDKKATAKKPALVFYDGEWITEAEKQKRRGVRDFMGSPFSSTEAALFLLNKAGDIQQRIDNMSDVEECAKYLDKELFQPCKLFYDTYTNVADQLKVKDLENRFKFALEDKRKKAAKASEPPPTVTPAPEASQELKASEISKRNIGSMAMIICDLPNGTSNGSGFIVRKDGLIATNRHVIEGARRIQVRLLKENNEGQLVASEPLPAELVRASDKYDLALLRIDAQDRELTPCKLAATVPDRGSDVVVIGNPSLGKSILAGSVTKGQLNNIVVSNNVELLQTNATVNPGNSGCPMFNTMGEVIGVITLKFDNPAERLSGVGFAIHIKHLLEEMKGL